MSELRTVILAAGKGTRMKSELPKVLHPICGRPLLQYVLDVARAIRSSKTYVVLGHQIDMIKSHVASQVDVVEQKQLAGTADAVRCVCERLKSYRGDVLVLCGDAPLLRKETLRAMIRRHRKGKAACTFLTAVVRNPQGYGRIIRGAQGKAVAIREETDASEFEKNIMEINAGVYVFQNTALLRLIDTIKANPVKKEFYLTDIIELLLEQGLKVDSWETDDPQECLGINSRAGLALATGVLQRRILNTLMDQGVTIVDPATTYIDADVRVGRDTLIRPCTVIEGDARIGKNCVLGPFTHVRPGSNIGNHVQIGNFAEVSRTSMGDQSLMKHFGFLGDAKLGRRVNIGAGVVTANYDGDAKHETIISDQAFIGSDSILVAPLKVGKKAITGAGSVVPAGKNVPSGSVVVGVPARRVKKR